MVHWLQIGGIKLTLKDENKQWNNLNEYLSKYPESKAEVYKKFTGDMFAKFIRLECEQNYNELDLDCNSMSRGSIRHLNHKPSNIEKCNMSVEWFIERNNNYSNRLIKPESRGL